MRWLARHRCVCFERSGGARPWHQATGADAPRREPGVTARRRKRPAAAREERDMDMAVLLLACTK